MSAADASIRGCAARGHFCGRDLGTAGKEARSAAAAVRGPRDPDSHPAGWSSSLDCLGSTERQGHLTFNQANDYEGGKRDVQGRNHRHSAVDLCEGHPHGV
jgi:hypothetical protein